MLLAMQYELNQPTYTLQSGEPTKVLYIFLTPNTKKFRRTQANEQFRDKARQFGPETEEVERE